MTTATQDSAIRRDSPAPPPRSRREPRAAGENADGPEAETAHEAVHHHGNPLLSRLAAVGFSLLVHLAILVGMYVIKIKLIDQGEVLAVDTVIEEERMQEQFTQELPIDTEISENLNPIFGGVPSAAAGSSGKPAMKQMRITTSDAIRTPEINVRAGDVTIPGDSELGLDLGEGDISGDIGAPVEGYGPALHRLAQELIRMMRESKVIVVWLFDRSHSMTDDQQEIKQNFHKIYEELGIAARQDRKLSAVHEILLTSIAMYGKELDFITPQPTADIDEIKAAIDKISIDPSGDENMCHSIVAGVRKFRELAARQDRKLVVVVVSDESGDDGQYVEEAIDACQKAKAPVYLLGRESMFGYPYGHIRWIDPKYNLPHWLRIRRGPETAYPECLQWNGLHARHDAHNAGFGPYEQVRIARETGGIYFILPGEEEDLTGEGWRERRKYDFLDMKEYRPLLLPRRDYQEARARSEFRNTIYKVIATLNPNKDAVEKGLLPMYDPQLNIRENWYPLENAAFRDTAAGEVVKAARAMSLLSTAIPMLEEIAALRAREGFQRWRAAYDLCYAQCVAFRVRLFQFLLAMDEHANNMPEPKRKETNRWSVRRTRKMLVPDDEQYERIKRAFSLKEDKDTYLALLKDEEQRAVDLYHQLIEAHPRTPWARRAQNELRQGFGMEFHEAFRDPRYDRRDIQFPNP